MYIAGTAIHPSCLSPRYLALQKGDMSFAHIKCMLCPGSDRASASFGFSGFEQPCLRQFADLVWTSIDEAPDFGPRLSRASAALRFGTSKVAVTACGSFVSRYQPVRNHDVVFVLQYDFIAMHPTAPAVHADMRLMPKLPPFPLLRPHCPTLIAQYRQAELLILGSIISSF